MSLDQEKLTQAEGYWIHLLDTKLHGLNSKIENKEGFEIENCGLSDWPREVDGIKEQVVEVVKRKNNRTEYQWDEKHN